MKVKKLIELLKKEDPNAEIGVWLAGDDGWEIVDLGVGDAIIGHKPSGEKNFVLLPVQLPDRLLDWEDGNDQETELDRDNRPIYEA
mgnify:CR=1 FL=1|tara:strand:+ start:151 stop:408 length:258 start_codon:yes stop_codon:yes gene_type:complete